MVINKNIALRIKHLRKERGLTQSQLAKCIGVSEITVRSYEAGRKPEFSNYGCVRKVF